LPRTTRAEQLADANRIIENSPTILYRVSPQYPYPLNYLSQNVSRYGYRADDLLAHPERWAQLIETADFPRVLANMQALSAGNEHTQNLQFRMRKADGSIVCFESRSSILRDGENRIVALEGRLSDVTERKRTETELSFTHSLLTKAIEGSPDAILVVDANGKIIMFNRHFVELWNIPEEIVRTGGDEPVLKGVSSQIKNESEFVARVRYLYSHPEIQSDEELETKDGRFIERHSGSLHDPQQKYLGRVWFFRDISEKKRGVNQFAVHYLDLDHFKDVNNTLGHPVGDKLLQAVAKRLKDCVRETDMVARFGGDEFAVLQDDISDSESVEALAAKLGEAIAIPYTIEDSQVQTTASIGIVPFRGDVAGGDAMMMKADLALYRAKNEGRNQFRFHVLELDEQTRERMIIGEELRHAIKRNELELFYQPQVEIKSGRIVGMEALIRWNHPKRGMILPASFIPIVETTGSIVPIGEWVIEHACEQIGAWNELGIAPTTIAVNLSSAQFKLASQLDKIVTDNLARYNIAPRQIELELTESVLLETTQRHADAFNRLRKIGVRLAIDDLGTGYSSLDYLRLFRVSRLKIDRRFIADVATSADDAAIVRATVGLAHELGIEVVEEGVETAGQRDFLIAASCKVAQGYLFGQPMPAAAAGELLRHNPASPPAPLKAAPAPIVRPRVPAAAAPRRRNSAARRAPR
jgi:diguanylate cyclase (GGDEF)-like protein/PAS domain S-box-containing protein